MLKLIKGKIKNIVAVIALASFLVSPISYAVQISSADAATVYHEKRHHEPPHKWDKDDDKDFDRGDVTAAVLIGGVIGAVIAKNT